VQRIARVPMQRGRPFEPGNKFGRGRPRGSRNKRTLLLEELLAGHTDALLRKALVMALQGDGPILRTLLGRILPHCKDGPVRVGTLRTGSSQEIAASCDQILKKVSNGTLTLAEGQECVKLLQGRLDMALLTDMESRLRALEQFRAPGGEV
jgi:hypothetical protein